MILLTRLRLIGLFSFLFASAFLLPGNVKAVTPGSGPKLLTLHLSPKVNAMGGSYYATMNNIDAIEENPAGTVYAKSLNMDFLFTKWIADINYFNIKGVAPLKIGSIQNLNVLATSSLILYPGVRHYDVQGNAQELLQVIEGYAGAGLSTTLFGFLNTGFLAKYIYRSINNQNYPAVALDIGFQIYYPLKLSAINLAAGLKNIGYDLQDNQMPTELYLGFAKDFFKGVLLAKLDVGTVGLTQKDSFISELYCSMGVEYNVQDIIVIRTGFRIDSGTVSPSIGFGSGLKWGNSKNLSWTLNYAYIPKLTIDEYNNHQISVGIRMFTEKEVKDNILFAELYDRKANLAYLRGNMEEAVKYWEMVLKYKKSSSVEKKIRQTRILLDEQEKQKNK